MSRVLQSSGSNQLAPEACLAQLPFSRKPHARLLWRCVPEESHQHLPKQPLTHQKWRSGSCQSLCERHLGRLGAGGHGQRIHIRYDPGEEELYLEERAVLGVFHLDVFRKHNLQVRVASCSLHAVHRRACLPQLMMQPLDLSSDKEAMSARCVAGLLTQRRSRCRR